MTTLLSLIATIKGIQWTAGTIRKLFWAIVAICFLFMSVGCTTGKMNQRFANSLTMNPTKTATAQLFPRIFRPRPIPDPAYYPPKCPPQEQKYITNNNYPLSMNRTQSEGDTTDNSRPPADRKDYLLIVTVLGLAYLALRQQQLRGPIAQQSTKK